MDTISELIAAGELVIEKRKKKISAPEKFSLQSNISDLDETCSMLEINTLEKDCNIQHKNLLVNQCSSFVNEEKQKGNSSETSWCSSALDKNSSGKSSKLHQENSYQTTSRTSNQLQNHSCTETFSQLHIQKLKEECGLIFSLGHSMAASLLNANRILHQLVSSESGKLSDSEESLLSEISSCNDSCKENEDDLLSSSHRIHNLLGLVSESYYRSKDQEDTLSHIRTQAVELLECTKDLLKKHHLGHLVADIDDNRSPARVMEEVKLGLMLLLGELPSQHMQQQTIELQESKNYQRRLEKKFDVLEKEFRTCNEEKTRNLVQLEIELERKAKELEEAFREISDLEQERENAEAKFQEEIKETERKKITLIEELIKVKEFNDELKTFADSESEKHNLLRTQLEEEVSILKSKIRTVEDRKTHENSIEKSVCKNCEEQQKLFSMEADEYKSKLQKVNLEKEALSDQIGALETDIEKWNDLNESLKDDIASLIEAAQNKSEETSSDMMLLEKKLDAKNEELCEKNSEIRQNEVVIMELKADLGLERQRNCSLSSEIDLLQKQVDGLGIKMRKIIGFCPREVRINCGLSHINGVDEAELDSKLSKYLEESQQRETELRKLMNEKDEELKELRQTLSDQLSQKNEELEKLTNSIENLEDEMSHINSALNLSSELFTASCKTSSYLDSRTKHIEAIEEQVHRKLLTSSCKSCEMNQKSVEDIKGEISEAKKAARAAREEARTERIEAARIKQQLAMMQIDLESARELAKYRSDRIPILAVPELRFTSAEESQETAASK